MSTKHLRRLLEEKEGQMQKNKKEKSSSESDKEGQIYPANRFALLEENDDKSFKSDYNSGTSEDCDTADGHFQNLKQMPKKWGKTKKKKKMPKKIFNIIKNSDDGELDLHIRSLDNLLVSAETVKFIRERDLFKVDYKALNADDELRMMLGRTSKNIVKNNRNFRIDLGQKIVRRDPSWPEFKAVGLSMEVDKVEGDRRWFKFVFSKDYIEYQKRFLLAVKNFDHHYIMNILNERPYHLDSSLMVASILYHQEEYQQSRILTERAIYGCQCAFSNFFELHNYDHIFDYSLVENRSFFLLLNQHMKNAFNRKCFQTALNLAKLIFRLCSIKDPMGILLIIDAIAIRARQFCFVIQAYETLEPSRNIERLPNFAFSVALAHFLLYQENGDEKNRESANEMLTKAIYHFPTVLLQILEHINLEPSASVLQNEFMCILAHHRETEGFQLLTSIYLKHTSDFWKDVSIISWVESVVEEILPTMNDSNEELIEWNAIRKRVYAGTPRTVIRHAWLWDIIRNSEWTLNDPVPPIDSRSSYDYLPPAEPPIDPLYSIVQEAIRNIHHIFGGIQLNVGLINSKTNTNVSIAHIYNTTQIAIVQLKIEIS
ncbi:unnamed protein product [Dracunculus medinensis]|uniref:Transcription factor 25 n=1 Tax=Dracunculus medinensis TaxID=318479 RepID=A0A0N4UFV4_DRAME|nr:unnamed protein product [Dracunculus medinensis]